MPFQNEGEIGYSGKDALIDAEVGLKNYNSHIGKVFARELSRRISKSKPILLDFGAGTGQVTEVVRHQIQSEVQCVEIDPSLVAILLNKGFKVFRKINLTHRFSGIFSSNVLEHVYDDVGILRNFNEVLEEDGLVVLYVPANKFLFSQLDHAVGHYRRYDKKEIISKFELAGFSVEKIRFVDSIGVLATLLLKFTGYRNGGILNVGGLRSLKIYDRYFFPISKLIDSLGAQFVLGKNLLIVARKIINVKN